MFSTVRGDFCADCQKEAFFPQPHWLCSAARRLRSTWQLFCEPWNGGSLSKATHKMTFTSSSSVFSSCSRLPLQRLQLSMMQLWSQLWYRACRVVLASHASGLSVPARVVSSWNTMRVSDFEPQQAKGKEKQGEKVLVLLYQFTHPLSQHKKPTAFTSGTAIQPLSQHPHCPSSLFHTRLCA